MKQLFLHARAARIWICAAVLAAVFFCGGFFSAAPAAVAWKESSSDHFVLFFTNNEEFAKDVLYKAEEYYRTIASVLGYPRYSEFWLWNKRVKIYIHPDQDSFLKATGQPQWSQGMADYRKKEIVSYAWSSGFIESLLPHEMAHLIFRDFVGFKGEIPLWLDEGVAQYSEEQKRLNMRVMAKQRYEEDALLSIKDMMKINIWKLQQGEKLHIRPTKTKDGEIGVLFMGNDAVVTAYYLQGFSLVDFLIERYGAEDFTYFCRQLRDGKSLEEALRYAYPAYIQSLAELEMKWREYLRDMDVSQIQK